MGRSGWSFSVQTFQNLNDLSADQVVVTSSDKHIFVDKFPHNPSLVRNLFLYPICIDVTISVRLHKNRSSTVDGISHDTRNISVCRNKRFVPGSDAKEPKGKPQRIQTAGKPYTVFVSCFSWVSSSFFYLNQLYRKYRDGQAFSIISQQLAAHRITNL